MEKKICAYIFAVTFIALSSIVHGQSAVDRSPSVEPMAEVDIQAKEVQKTGYDFAGNEAPNRVPANIVTKTDAQSSTSYIGPIIFLVALPIGLWIMISKKFSKSAEDRRVGYYPKTQQFKPYTTDYQKTAEDDETDYPKAS
jgi:hypothetical protein